MFIRTERLFLRPVFAEDWREILAGVGHEQIVRMLARAPWPYSEEDARSFCESQDDPAACRFAITLPGPQGAPVIGTIGLDEGEGGLELGYWIAREHWGQGYAVEAGRHVLALARALGHRRVHAGHYIDNSASGRVLARLGFAETGELRPTFCRGRGGEMVLARRYALDLADCDACPQGLEASA
ncbi:GNAT family N-acetyltransferase [Altererythrobacter sp. B11]|uniref:GNAT family N-acetyltransferase n=1 Tax=Altererythrobacter sp. B11 TaxID=2060312 RepID=UPI000DC70D88|nr:GNAT family N-acetyltransferase [Altererythrobacter sp. B11]BBC72286.1 GNAT family N-acetyltransferase [Altererythrobacter sp. B11]